MEWDGDFCCYFSCECRICSWFDLEAQARQYTGCGRSITDHAECDSPVMLNIFTTQKSLNSSQPPLTWHAHAASKAALSKTNAKRLHMGFVVSLRPSCLCFEHGGAFCCFVGNTIILF